MESSADERDQSVNHLTVAAKNMAGWLKFVGIITIISGALTAISIVGIIIAWLPIWLGVLLVQAGGKAGEAQLKQDHSELIVMMDKLRLYFMIQGILIIIGLAFTLIMIFGFGISLLPFLSSFR